MLVHQIRTDHAIAYGVPVALILGYMAQAQDGNNSDSVIFSKREMEKAFPYLSVGDIRTAFDFIFYRSLAPKWARS